MRLKDLQHPQTEGAPYLGTLNDSGGDQHYELAISGASKMIEKIFAESEFEYQIDPKATEKNWVPKYQEMWDRNTAAGAVGKGPETIDALDKAVPAGATAKNSIIVSIRRTDGKGTWWAFWFPLLALPAGANVFFILPPICNCAGVVVPLSGDPDLFLSANGPRTPIIAASTLGAGAI